MVPPETSPEWLTPLFLAGKEADVTALFGRLGMAALLGFLVGMQREHTEGGMPGLRTFPLITLCGSVFALLGLSFGGWLPAAALLCLVGLLFFPHWLRIRRADPDPGLTTSVAVILMYGVGALLVLTRIEIGVVLGGAVAVLLQFKPEIHHFAERLGDEDLRAIMQFVLITCIILPVLPTQPIDPLNVVSLFNVWLMVVLIVGISLGGYIAYKFFGARAGIYLAGILGGAVSSTATTISAARQARSDTTQQNAAAVVILLASTVMIGRIFVEIAVVNPAMLETSLIPLTILAVATYLPARFLRLPQDRDGTTLIAEHQNPTQLRSAIYFAVLYALVLYLIAWLKNNVGESGLYPLAILSGLHDMDAITISVSRMATGDQELAQHGWRYITAGALANMGTKTVLAGVMGNPRLGIRVALAFLPGLITGLILIVFWP
ncbi:MgtC family [Thermogutta terrifontis]|jgi:uncharacterized membrane protein (DUF4010 family)|uniref:MgtC family n=1 Tax=Thermogutta terrifontis TaxID=1331910 RepID=A0A286RED7_9BACT|nr:MgtC/SapB family protein [Thermogutta terrifontis]ASV74321.1 MgtC family [Thermogutta terrifontis]